MKKFLLIILIIYVSGTGFSKQIMPPNDTFMNNQNNPAINLKTWKDSTVSVPSAGNSIPNTNKMKFQSYYLQNGKLYQYTGGKLKIVNNSVTLKNGTTISPQGMVKMKNGKSMQLQTTEGIDMNGDIAPYKP